MVLQSLRGKSQERSYGPLVSQTRINISAICNRIFMVPCKLDTQEKYPSVQKFIWTCAETGSKLITEIRGSASS